MKTIHIKTFLPSILLIAFLSQALQAQDSLTTKQPLEYSTVGFQISQVSGIGISYGRNLENSYRFRFTGGVLSGGSNTVYFSFGTDYEYELTKNKPFRVFIGPAIGVWGVSNEPAHINAALGTGMEAPITGTTIFENVSVGAEVYYPTFYFLGGTIGVAGGLFISYNF